MSSSTTLNNTEYNRPRRPNNDTITYLRGLPLDVNLAHEEIQQYLLSNRANSKTKKNNDNKKDGAGDDDEELEYPSCLIAVISALNEISKHEIASLAGDEYGSQCIELIARIICPYSELASRILLQGCSGYLLHLATHRYGSHVLQTIIQLSCNSHASSSNDDDDIALHDVAPTKLMENEPNFVEYELPPLTDLIYNMAYELVPYISDLSVHICGSHVLRTMLCVLGGVQFVDTKGATSAGGGGESESSSFAFRGRTKNKKKKKKKPTTAGADGEGGGNGNHAGMMRVVYSPNSRLLSNVGNRNNMKDALGSLSKGLIGISDDNAGDNTEAASSSLQQRACHQSAGPLIIVLLRVLTYASSSRSSSKAKDDGADDDNEDPQQQEQENPANNPISAFRLGILPKEPYYEMNSSAHELVKYLLNWHNNDESSAAFDGIYNLAGDPRGSHVLETILRLSPDEVYEKLLTVGQFLPHPSQPEQDTSQDTSSPSTMKEYIEHDVSNFVVQSVLCTIRSKEQAESIIKVIEPFISNGYIIDMQNRRRGILWRCIEVASKYRLQQQESLLKSMRLGFGTVLKNSSNEEDANAVAADANAVAAAGDDAKKKKKQRKKASSVNIEDCIAQLINVRKPQIEGGRAQLDVSGSRTVYHLLRFTPRLCEDTLKGIIEGLDADEIQLIAKDGLGSVCIIDGILDGAIQTPVFAAAIKKLQAKLAGCWVSLATDRVGHHMVKKMFLALPKIDDKAKLVNELCSGYNRLSGTSMGRSVIETCIIDEYRQDKKQWRTVLSKQLMTSNKKDNEHSDKKGKNKNKKDTGKSLVDEFVPDPDSKSSSKRKRKRKRSKEGKDGRDPVSDANKNSKTESKQSPKSKILSLDSIMNSISIPTSKK